MDICSIVLGVMAIWLAMGALATFATIVYDTILGYLKWTDFTKAETYFEFCLCIAYGPFALYAVIWLIYDEQVRHPSYTD